MNTRWLTAGTLLVQTCAWVVFVFIGVALGRRTTSVYLSLALLGVAVVLFLAGFAALWRGMGVSSVWDGDEDPRNLTWFGRAIARLGGWWRAARRGRGTT